MATNTYKSFLMKGSGTTTVTYQKLVDITDYPDLGGAPDALETTTLSDGAKTFILGIQGGDVLTFNTNYDKTTYQALVALKGVQTPYAVWFGGTESNGEVEPDGTDGKFGFEGFLDVTVTGAGVNEVRKMSISIAPATVIKASFSS